MPEAAKVYFRGISRRVTELRFRVLVQIESTLVVQFETGILLFLLQDTIADNQRFNLRPHETTKSVAGCTNDRFAANVETGIDDHRASGQVAKAADQGVITRVGLPADGLNPRRIIDVGDSGNFRARNVQSVDPEQMLLLVGHRKASILTHAG